MKNDSISDQLFHLELEQLYETKIKSVEKFNNIGKHILIENFEMNDQPLLFDIEIKKLLSTEIVIRF